MTHTDTGPVLGVSTLVRVPRRVIEQVRSQKKKEKMSSFDKRKAPAMAGGAPVWGRILSSRGRRVAMVAVLVLLGILTLLRGSQSIGSAGLMGRVYRFRRSGIEPSPRGAVFGSGDAVNDAEERDYFASLTDAQFELMCKSAGDIKPAICNQARRRGGSSRSRQASNSRPSTESKRKRNIIPPRMVSVDGLHSSHSCYGRDYTPNNWQRATCMYNDVCVHQPGPGENHTFYYIVRTDFEKDHIADVVSQKHLGDSHLDVSLAPMGQGHDNQKFQPRIVTEAEFKSIVGPDERAMYFSNIHLLYISYNAENFGHFLSDELFPAYSILESFDELDYNVQFVRVQVDPPLQFSCDYQRANWGEEQWLKCQYRYLQMMPLMSRNPVYTLRNYTRLVAKSRTVCFKKLAAGMGMHADHCEDGIGHGRAHDRRHDCNQGRQNTLYNYRRYVMGNIGLASTQPSANSVVIWDRNKKDYKAERKIYGLPELKTRIQDELGLPVLLYESWHAKPIKYQIKKLSEATVFITGPGSGSFISWFLPRGSTQIRLYPTKGIYMLEWFIFNYMSHMHTEHVDASGGQFDQDAVMALVQMAVHRYDHFLDSYAH